jgi:L-arabinose isomerase
MRAAWHVDLDAAEAVRSARLALALEDLFREQRLDAAALNCHSGLLRDNPEIGLVACYGASRLTAMGLPVACTGDLTVAVAMLAATALGGEAHCCEAVALDVPRDWLLLTNTGEGDPRLARPDAPRRIEANRRFPGACGCGAKVIFACRPGVSTLVAFTPQAGVPGGHTFVVARGQVLDAVLPGTGVPSAAFRFCGRGCIEGFELWCAAGAPHHAVLAAGDLTEPMRQLGAMWGTGVSVI